MKWRSPLFFLVSLTLITLSGALSPVQAQTIRSTTKNFQTGQSTNSAPRKKVRRPAPKGSEFFGFRGRWYGGIAAGVVGLHREIKVNSNTNGERIYYTESDRFVGVADGSTYTITEDETLQRMDVRVGFQRMGDGDFLELGYYTASRIAEMTGAYGLTLPSWSIDRNWLIPYLKFGVGLGYAESTNLAPTSFSYGLDLGSYTWWWKRRLKTRYELGYAKRDWLDIEKSFGTEKWADEETRMSVGIDWFF